MCSAWTKEYLDRYAGRNVTLIARWLLNISWQKPTKGSVLELSIIVLILIVSASTGLLFVALSRSSADERALSSTSTLNDMLLLVVKRFVPGFCHKRLLRHIEHLMQARNKACRIVHRIGVNYIKVNAVELPVELPEQHRLWEGMQIITLTTTGNCSYIFYRRKLTSTLVCWWIITKQTTGSWHFASHISHLVQ